MKPVTGRPESARELRGERNFTGLLSTWHGVDDASVPAPEKPARSE